MDKRILKLALVLVVASLPVACDQPPCGPEVAEGDVMEADTGKAVELSVDKELHVLLADPGTSTNEWRVTRIDNAVVTQVGDVELVADCGSVSGAPWASDTAVFTFKGVAPGTTTLELAYLPVGDGGATSGDEPAEKTFKVDVTVK